MEVLREKDDPSPMEVPDDIKNVKFGKPLSLRNQWDVFAAHRRRRRALIMGTGQSALLINETNVARVKEMFDVWSANHFYFHPHLVPDYAHLQMRKGGAPFWFKHFYKQDVGPKYGGERWKKYRNTHFILSELGDKDTRVASASTELPFFTYPFEEAAKNKPMERRLVGVGHEECHNPRKDKHRGDPVKTFTAASDCRKPPREYCFSSLTTMVDIALSVGYEEVYVMGVDGGGGHFYHNAEYKDKYFGYIKHKNGRAKEKGAHSMDTSGAHDWLHRLAKQAYTKEGQDGVRMYNLSPVSKGKYSLPYKHLDDVLKQKHLEDFDPPKKKIDLPV